MYNGTDGRDGRNGADGRDGSKGILNYSQYYNNTSQTLENNEFLTLNTKILSIGSSITLNGTNKFNLTSGTYQVNFRVIIEGKCLIYFDDTYSVRNDNDAENILNLSFIYTTNDTTTVGLKITELTTELTCKFAQLTIIKIKGNIFYLPSITPIITTDIIYTNPPTISEDLTPINPNYIHPRPTEPDVGFLSCSIM